MKLLLYYTGACISYRSDINKTIIKKSLQLMRLDDKICSMKMVVKIPSQHVLWVILTQTLYLLLREPQTKILMIDERFYRENLF